MQTIMLSSRVTLVLFLTLLTVISTAPIVDSELVTNELITESTNTTITESFAYEDDKYVTVEQSHETEEQDIQSTPVNYEEETTCISEDPTTDLIVVNINEASANIDNVINATGHILIDIETDLTTSAITEKLKFTQSTTIDDEQIQYSIMQHYQN
ncbi:unnamed protein product [Rotaria socialis]|uniref:Uncharacterized protein n=2 Tax=Rotaria socialis TaxID=392032 RepID=A0A820N972_9BILA|nr:unnamed protein product [Rotaria socialis]CAF3497416.1 unnamed protein product [Rotaria socialis]CAF4385214.1 unnamed protein product [Rotaria socialis]